MLGQQKHYNSSSRTEIREIDKILACRQATHWFTRQ